jgi:hypothetical protein
MSTIKLDHVPLLESALNFPEWKRFTVQILQAEGYWTHVEGTDGAYDIFPKSLEPAACTAASKADEKAAFKAWWQEDMRARAIILRRSSPVTHSHLDTAVGKTARSIWENLHTLYERTDILSQFDLRDRLANAKLWDYQDIDRYLGEFKDARLRFIAMNITYTEFEMVHHIIRGIPDSGVWGHFRQLMTQTMQDHVERERRATTKCEPDTLLNQITMRLTIECQRLESENRSRFQPHQGPDSEYTSFSRDDNPIRKHAHNPKGDRSSKTELAAFTDVQGFLEALEDDAELSCASIEGVLDDSTDSESVMNSWSTLLDSGATSHLVKGRDYFWTYNKEAARTVRTANLGVLQTRASGTCVVRFTYNGVSTRVTLRNCLHAPNASVNLLSVGRFVTAEISCTFDEERVLLSKMGKTFGHGPMINNLFLLEVEFLKPPIISPVSALSIQHQRLPTPCTSTLLELIRLDICGPFPVTIDVRDAWRVLKAKKVQLALEGIEVEVLAAYEHWKNGRIKQSMRTIQGKIDSPRCFELPPNPCNLDNSPDLDIPDTAPTSRPSLLNTKTSPSRYPLSSSTPPSSCLQVIPSTPKPVRTRSCKRSQIRKLMEKGHILKTAARRGGADRMGGSSGGGVDDNPFAALCNNGVLDEYMSTTDSAQMAASLDANNYLQRDIDSLWEAMLLSIRGDVRQAFLWGDFTTGFFLHRPPPNSVVTPLDPSHPLCHEEDTYPAIDDFMNT